MSLVNFQRAVVIAVIAIFLAMPFGVQASPTDGTIDPVYKYAWGENIGWVNFGSYPEGNVHITDTGMTGYAWGENVGWISLNCSNTSSCGTVSYGVSGDGTGDLAGYAWGENIGWLSFSCSNTSSCGTADYGVDVSPTGAFSGYAWGENVGWLSFNCSNTSSCGTADYRVQTDYVPGSGAPTPTPTPTPGGGGGGGGGLPPPVPSGTPGPTASPTPTTTPTGTPGPTPSGTPGPTVSPTPSPSGTPEPSGTPPPATPTGTPPPGIIPPGIFPDGVQDFINQGLQNALEIAQAIAEALVELFEIVAPVVEESAEPVSIFTAIATAISTIVSIAPFIGSVSAFGNLLQFLVQGLQNLPIFGVKRRRKLLGTVYDAKTKQPVPFAKVDLLNSNFRVLDSQITDLQGRYAFLLTPEYADQKFMEIRIQVHKNEYVFPSVTIKPPSDTILYYNVYIGGTANVDVDVLAGFDLPMDPLKPQIYAVAVKKPLTKLRNFITKLLDILFYVGLVTVPLSYILDPSGFHLAILIAFFAINIPRFFGLVGRQFGLVVDSSTGAPMPFALITVTNSDGKRVGFTVSDERGRYFLLVPEGDYTLSAFTPATIIPERTFSKQLSIKKGWIRDEIPL